MQDRLNPAKNRSNVAKPHDVMRTQPDAHDAQQPLPKNGYKVYRPIFDSIDADHSDSIDVSELWNAVSRLFPGQCTIEDVKVCGFLSSCHLFI